MKTLGKELNKTCYSLAPKHSVFVASFLSPFLINCSDIIFEVDCFPVTPSAIFSQ